MGYKITTSVWDHSKAKGGDLTVLLAIADNADNETAVAFPSIRSLAEKSRLSERTVQYAIGRLKRLGELSVISGGAGRGSLSFYRVDLHLRLRLEKGASLAPFIEEEREQALRPLLREKGCKRRQERVQTTTGKGANDDSAIMNARANTLEPSVEPSRISLSVSHPQTLTKIEREIVEKDLKRLFPGMVSLPEAIPSDRAFLFWHKVRTGEVRREQIYSPVAYMAKMLDEDISAPLRQDRERRARSPGGG